MYGEERAKMGLKNPYLFTILIQIMQTGMTLFTKAAFDGGKKNFIFIVYRQLARTIFLLLLSTMFKRRSAAPLTFLIFFKISALAFLGKEKLNVREIAGVAKLGGITISMGGVATLAFFKGPILNPPFVLHNAQPQPPHQHQHQHQHHVSSSGSTTWVIGRFLSFISDSSWGLWCVLQRGESKMRLKNPYVLAILMQTLDAGMTLLTKVTVSGGMKTFVFIFYRQLTGTVFLLLLTAIFERRSPTPLTFLVFFKIFALAFLGLTLAMNLYGIALLYTSASLASATINCVPVTTFFFAVLLRKEKLNVREIAGVAKLGGITICMGGVAILAFFKGPILIPHFALHNPQPQHQHQHHVSSSGSTTWAIGCFLSFISVLSWGLWFVLQAGVLKAYPSKLHFTSLQCLSSTVQSFLVAIAVERDLSEWKLTWNVALLAVLYCGIMVTGVSHYLQSWVIAEKGPVFRAMSTPLSPILTMIGSMVLLGENINLGSIVGEVMLVAGLYSVLWGHTHEQNLATESSLPVQAEKKCINAEDQEPKSGEARYLVA